ncbi:MAG TPA: hypothetical protein VLA56_16050 [Pseudomonadales bacterium]|nr:hypothetical protein [Pseudomonadales bacterium]
MTRAIELNDSGVRLADAAGRLLIASPGYAVVNARRLLVGEAALRESRLDPRHTTSQFWQRLSMDPVQHPHPEARTQADLAHAHLLHVWGAADGGDPDDPGAADVIFAIPGQYGREQLALLLGIVRECPFRAVGLVDAAVAAVGHAQPDAEHVVHVDTLLHQSVITSLTATADGWQRASVLDLPALGLAGLREAWVKLIADAFIRETRFDPLHDAATEQRLFDRIDAWVAALKEQDELQVELEAGGNVYRVELDRARMIDSVAPRYEALREALLRGLGSRAGRVLLGPELGRLPGLAALLQRDDRLDVEILEADAAVRGALDHESSIRHDGEALRFVTRLPRRVRTAGAPAAAAPVPQPEPEPEPIASGGQAAAGDAAAGPTHVLLGDTAWPLTGKRLAVGGADGIAGDRYPDALATLERIEGEGPDGAWRLTTPDGRTEPLPLGAARVVGAERVILSLIRVRAT